MPHWDLQASAGAPGLAINWRGEWDNLLSYNPYDAVQTGTSTWISLTNNSGIDPETDDGTNWSKMVEGATGPQGPIGPAGGGAIQGEWNWVAAAISSGIATGKVGANHDDPNLATQLVIHKLSQDNVDWSTAIGNLKSPDGLYLQQRDNAAFFHRFRIIGVPTLSGNEWMIPVMTEAGSTQGTEPENNKPLVVAMAYSAPGREVLTANRTYYVRTNGNDSNNGLTNTSGGAFLTIQKAIDTVAALNIAIYDVTIQLADGTYTAGASITGGWQGSGTVYLNGNPGSPASVIISVTNDNCIAVLEGGRLAIGGMELRTITNGSALTAFYGGMVRITGAMRFGACAGYHMSVQANGIVLVQANYSVVGSATNAHLVCACGGAYQCLGRTITFSGTLTFVNTVSALRQGVIEAHGSTFSGGTVTATRYTVDGCGVIFTNGGGANFFPGSIAGVAVTGGQYY